MVAYPVKETGQSVKLRLRLVGIVTLGNHQPPTTKQLRGSVIDAHVAHNHKDRSVTGDRNQFRR